jgi:hypothetical protein
MKSRSTHRSIYGLGEERIGRSRIGAPATIWQGWPRRRLLLAASAVPHGFSRDNIIAGRASRSPGRQQGAVDRHVWHLSKPP